MRQSGVREGEIRRSLGGQRYSDLNRRGDTDGHSRFEIRDNNSLGFSGGGSNRFDNSFDIQVPSTSQLAIVKVAVREEKSNLIR